MHWESDVAGYGNKYYKVEDRFRILKNIGSSPSNTYIGSSRSCTSVFEDTTAEVGDEIHDLVGGMFHVCAETGATTSIRLVPQKSILEKSYGGDPNNNRRDALLLGEYLKLQAEPVLVGDYKGATDLSNTQFPEFTGGIRTVDRDPLEDVSDEIIDALQDQGVDMDPNSIKFTSETAYGPAETKFAVAGVDDPWRLIIGDDGRLILIAPSELNQSPQQPGNHRFDALDDIVTPMAKVISELQPSAPTPR
jgi:hypothetical protein